MPTAAADQFVELLRPKLRPPQQEELASLAARHRDGLRLLEAVVAAKLAPKHVPCECWATVLGVAYVDPFTAIVAEDAVELIPVEVARKARVLGLYLLADVLTVATITPDDQDLVRRLSQITQRKVSPVFALPQEIDAAIAVHYATERTLEDNLAALEKSGIFAGTDGELAPDQLDALASSKGVTQVLDDIVFHAVRERASDLHFEPNEQGGALRIRVDGSLRTSASYTRKLHSALVSRIKILCGLDISETRLPQDGRFSMPLGRETVNMRVSTLPSHRGEKTVVRMLPMSSRSTILTLDGMFVSQSILRPFRRLIRSPNGILFVTGPTGSGKTTTLYSALHEINTPDINISTIEDPVEIELAGVTQTQANAGIDLTFARVLRSLLRQDPDVILVGEIRDLETAKIATEAALTGHLVFATLHTNNAPQAITRLVELGVDRSIVAPSVIGVVGQRLARRICTMCKEAYQPAPEVLARHFHDAEGEDVTFYRGIGCKTCRNTGYRGQIAFHELVVVNDAVRTAVTQGGSVQEISRVAAHAGYRPLRYDGLKKVLLGLTTIEEVEASTPVDWTA